MGRKTNQWYPKYPGDYARDTAHLSMLEHGAFNLLLDYYYANNGLYTAPVDNQGAFAGTNVERLYRICRATNRDEQRAVDTVLTQFFPIIGGRYTNKKADEIIEKRTGISVVRKKARAERERKKRATNVPTNVPANVTHNQNHIYTPLPPKGGAPAARGLKMGSGEEGGGFRIEPHLSDADRAAAKKAAPGWDLHYLIRAYDEGAAARGRPKKPGMAFVAWCASYTKGKKP